MTGTKSTFGLPPVTSLKGLHCGSGGCRVLSTVYTGIIQSQATNPAVFLGTNRLQS